MPPPYRERFIIDPIFKNKVFRYIDWLEDITHKVGLTNFRVTIDNRIDKIGFDDRCKLSAFTRMGQKMWAIDAINSINFDALYVSGEVGEKAIIEKALFMHLVGDCSHLNWYYEQLDNFNEKLFFLHKELFPESKTQDYISETKRLLKKFYLPDNIDDLKSWQLLIKFKILDDLKQTKNTQKNEDFLDHCCAGFNSMLSKYCSNLQCWQENICAQHAGTNLTNPI